MIWASNNSCRTTYLSPEWQEFTGQSLEEGARSEWRDVIHPDDFDVVSSTFRSACSKASSFWMVYRLKHKDDGWVWVLSGANPAHDPATHAYIGFLGSINTVELTAPIEAHGELAPFRPSLPHPLTPPKTHLEMVADLALVAYAAAEEGGETELLEAIQAVIDQARAKLVRDDLRAVPM